MSMMSKAERSAMPVMMPGSAIGRMNSSEIVSRPKNFARDSAAAASVPKHEREQRWRSRDLEREPERRPDVGALGPGDAEPLVV